MSRPAKKKPVKKKPAQKKAAQKRPAQKKAARKKAKGKSSERAKASSATGGKASSARGTKTRPEDSTAVAPGWGTFNLGPIAGSPSRETYSFDVELTASGVALTLGDLRRAAERASSASVHEIAHRLWTVVAEAARRVENLELGARASSMADGALHLAKQDAGPRESAGNRRSKRRSGANRPLPHDYGVLAVDRATGMTQAAVAAKWNCSPGTVARAVRYVHARDELFATHSEAKDLVTSGMSPSDIADKFDVPTKVVRWIVRDSANLDR